MSIAARLLISLLSVSGIIIGILSVKIILKKHISAVCQYRIWFLVIGVLTIPLLPFSMKWPFFIWDKIKGFFLSNTNMDMKSVSSQVNDSIKQISQSSIINDFAITVDHKVFPAFLIILLCVWMVGMIFFIACTIRSNRNIYIMKRNAKTIPSMEIQQLFKACKKEALVSKKVCLVMSAYTQSPVTFGLFKTYIILPDQVTLLLSKEEIRYILLHELYHIKQKDIAINYLVCLFQIIYWFHPLVWIAFKYMKIDREIACDNAVLSMLNEDCYTSYGHTIITYAQKFMSISHLNVAAQMGGSKKQLVKRIESIAVYKKESKWLKVKSFFIITLVACMIIGQIPMLGVYAFVKNTYSFNDSCTEEDLGQFFYGYQGCFVMYDSNKDSYNIYNKDKSIERVSPASTYKIYSGLLGLEENIIKPDQSIMKWDGKENVFPSWNKDQDISSAMKNSVNWYFQGLDKQLGMNKLTEFYHNIGYGNEDLSGGLSNYWMESSLLISPIEQVMLLKALNENEFGFKETNIQAIKDSISIMDTKEAKLWGKTGSSIVKGKGNSGWFVGFVQTKGNTYYFSVYIEDQGFAKGKTASDIAMQILKEKAILD